MNRKVLRALLWNMVALFLLGGLLSLSPPARADGTVPGRVLVRVDTDDDEDDVIREINADYGTVVEQAVKALGLYCLRVPRGEDETEFARRLNRDRRVIYAEPDTYLELPEVDGVLRAYAFDAGPDAGEYVNQTAYHQVNLGQTHEWTLGTGVIIAVLDSGATFHHPALRRRYMTGYNAIKPARSPRDVPDGQHNQGVGHGTMIAGIIAKLAPKARILPVRVLNGDGRGRMIDVLQGLHYAIKRRAAVINMSFKTRQPSRALNEVIAIAIASGATLVASAGNDGTDVPQYPAACEGVLAVAALEEDNRKWAYSNYGAYVAVAAPGVGIRSTYWTGGYANWSGTSFAAPFVAAQAALTRAAAPGLPAEGIVSAIRSSAVSIDALNPDYIGGLGSGLIDIEQSVRQIR